MVAVEYTEIKSVVNVGQVEDILTDTMDIRSGVKMADRAVCLAIDRLPDTMVNIEELKADMLEIKKHIRESDAQIVALVLEIKELITQIREFPLDE